MMNSVLQLLEDTAAQGDIAVLEDNFKGLYIRSTTDGSSMIGLNFNENPDFNDGIARLHVYYTKTAANGIRSSLKNIQLPFKSRYKFYFCT